MVDYSYFDILKSKGSYLVKSYTPDPVHPEWVYAIHNDPYGGGQWYQYSGGMWAARQASERYNFLHQVQTVAPPVFLGDTPSSAYTPKPVPTPTPTPVIRPQVSVLSMPQISMPQTVITPTPQYKSFTSPSGITYSAEQMRQMASGNGIWFNVTNKDLSAKTIPKPTPVLTPSQPKEAYRPISMYEQLTGNKLPAAGESVIWKTKVSKTKTPKEETTFFDTTSTIAKTGTPIALKPFVAPADTLPIGSGSTQSKSTISLVGGLTKQGEVTKLASPKPVMTITQMKQTTPATGESYFMGVVPDSWFDAPNQLIKQVRGYMPIERALNAYAAKQPQIKERPLGNSAPDLALSYIRGVAKEAEERPTQFAATLGIGYITGSAFGYVGAGALRAAPAVGGVVGKVGGAAVGKAATTMVKYAPKVVGAALTAAYGYDVVKRVSAEPTPVAQAYRAGRITMGEIVPFGVGAALSTVPVRELPKRIKLGFTTEIKPELQQMKTIDLTNVVDVRENVPEIDLRSEPLDVMNAKVTPTANLDKVQVVSELLKTTNLKLTPEETIQAIKLQNVLGESGFKTLVAERNYLRAVNTPYKQPYGEVAQREAVLDLFEPRVKSVQIGKTIYQAPDTRAITGMEMPLDMFSSRVKNIQIGKTIYTAPESRVITAREPVPRSMFEPLASSRELVPRSMFEPLTKTISIGKSVYKEPDTRQLEMYTLLLKGQMARTQDVMVKTKTEIKPILESKQLNLFKVTPASQENRDNYVVTNLARMGRTKQDTQTLQKAIVGQATRQATQQITQQATSQLTRQLTRQATQQITQQATSQLTRQLTRQLTQQMTGQTTQQLTRQTTQQITRQETPQLTRQITRQLTKQTPKTDVPQNPWTQTPTRIRTPDLIYVPAKYIPPKSVPALVGLPSGGGFGMRRNSRWLFSFRELAKVWKPASAFKGTKGRRRR